MPEAMPSAMLSFELSALPMWSCRILNYYGLNHIYLANNLYLCRKKEGVYEYQRKSFDIYGRANGCHAS